DIAITRPKFSAQKSMSWVIVITVFPWSFNFAITCAMRAIFTASWPVVGSSKITIGVSIAIIEAIATIFRQVGDRSYGLVSVLSDNSVSSSASFTSAATRPLS